MIIEVDVESAVPPYEQLREQITTMIGSGVLAAGTRLPAIRQLATDLDLAAGTVARAYRELENTNLIETRGRHGTFVLEPPALSAAERRRRIDDEARRFARAAGQLGISAHDAMGVIRQALQS
jgi:DNA-binding transcriptional regulator YhcF (GntR family)